MKPPLSLLLALSTGALSLFMTGCTGKDSADSEALLAADLQFQEDLAMYVTTWDQIVNEGRIDLINEDHFTPGITLVASPENIVGIEAFKEYYKNFLSGFSDIEFTVDNAFGQGDKIVKHWTFKGIHTGDFFGIPATGNPVILEGVTLVKMKDGKIDREQDFFDNLELMQQLGIIPRE